jgi:hypothetical protein
MYTVRKSATKLRHKTRRRIHQKGGDDDTIKLLIFNSDNVNIDVPVYAKGGDTFDSICKNILRAIIHAITYLKHTATKYYIKPDDNRPLYVVPIEVLLLLPRYKVNAFHYLYLDITRINTVDFITNTTMYFMTGRTIVDKIQLNNLMYCKIYNDGASITTRDANNVYTYLGHGYDVPVNNGKGSFIRHKMPTDCVYITVAQCGVVSDMWGYFIRLFASTDPYTCGVLNDPVGRQDELKELFTANNMPGIHIHYSGAATEDMQTYTEASFTGGMTWAGNEPYLRDAFKGSPRIAISGLHKHADFKYDKPSLETNAAIIPDAAWKDTIWNQYSSGKIGSPVVNNNRVSLEVFAILQTATDINDALKQIHNIKITLTELFRSNPGVYYNPVCRAVAGHNYTTGALHRAASGTP